MDNKYVQIENNDVPLTGTTTYTIPLVCREDGVYWGVDVCGNEYRLMSTKGKHPYVPESIHVTKNIVVVKWSDGRETKVTCVEGDTFDIQTAFAYACMYRMFGNNKSQFKEKWWQIIARRVKVHEIPDEYKPKAVKKAKK